MYGPYQDYAMLHGTYVRPSDVTRGHDAVIAAIKNIKTGEHKLHVIKDPMFEYWITKRQFRHQNIRLERELLTRLDPYVCHYKDLWESVANALGEKYFPYRTKELKENPHLYGVDV